MDRSPLKVFIADDSQPVADMLTELLSAPGWAVHNHASYDDYVYELTVQDQPLNIYMESLLWQENLQQPAALLGAQPGFDTSRGKVAV